MNAFRWTEEPGQLESLAVCLRSLTAQAGRPADYDELIAGLGLGWLVVADERHALGDWPTLARDALLVATAEQFGVRLRDLHPRRAAVGLESSAEFRLHFIDSYVPLIERALSCGQLAIAWRGWPAPGEMQWGVVTACSDGIVGGYTQGYSGEQRNLISPAQQVYIVEEVAQEAAPVDPAASFARAAWAASAQERGAWSSDPQQCTGVQAWKGWKARLLRDELTDDDARAYEAGALSVAAARDALRRWLLRVAGELTGAQRTAAIAWSAYCESAAQRLRETTLPEGSASADLVSWRARTAAALDGMAEQDALAVEIFTPHARPIAVRPAYEPDPLSV